MRRKKEPVPVGQILGRWIKRGHFGAELKDGQLRLRWAELVGDRIAARSEPQRLRRGVLTVHVAESAWLTEMTFLRDQLLREIEACMPELGVYQLRLVLGPVRQHRPNAPRPEPRPLAMGDTERAVPQAARDVPELEDAELRQHIIEAHAAQLAREDETKT